MKISFKDDYIRFQFYGTALCISGLCCFLFYPGIFSVDSFSQFQQAYKGSYDSWHPAVMSLLMHYLYPVGGVGGLFLLHQILYWITWALFFDLVLQKPKKKYLLIGLFPPLFLTSLTIWKDTGMMISLFLCVVLLFQYLKHFNHFILIPVFVLLFYAFNVRLNGFIIVAALIFAFLIPLIYFKYSQIFISFVIALSITICISVIFIISNNIFCKAYEVKQVSSLPSLVLFDAAGSFKEDQLNDAEPPTWALRNRHITNNWIKEYRPYSCSLCWTSEISCNGTPELNKTYMTYWVNTILDHPISYLKHRLTLTSYLFGLRSSFTYYPFQSHKYQTQLDSKFHIKNIGVVILYPFYITSYFLSLFFLYQPALYLLVSIYCAYKSTQKLFLDRIYDKNSIFLLCMSSSSVLSGFSLVFIAVAADYRYMIWTVLSGIVCFIVLFNKEKLDNVADHRKVSCRKTK